jgi:predicted lipoprotein with Yx(FWY)xxD motif
VTSSLVRRAAPGVVALILLAACAPAGGESSSTPPAAASAGAGPMLSVAQTSAGAALTGQGGRTLYEFAKDTGQTSACTDTCATNWPPLTVAAGESASAGSGADATMVGTISRPDGGTQVTYNGHPLYYFAGDSAAGDINGQGLNGVWFIAAPDGTMAGASAEATATPASSGGYGY